LLLPVSIAAVTVVAVVIAPVITVVVVAAALLTIGPGCPSKGVLVLLVSKPDSAHIAARGPPLLMMSRQHQTMARASAVR
jgi:hypothetical protein